MTRQQLNTQDMPHVAVIAAGTREAMDRLVLHLFGGGHDSLLSDRVASTLEAARVTWSMYCVCIDGLEVPEVQAKSSVVTRWVLKAFNAMAPLSCGNVPGVTHYLFLDASRVPRPHDLADVMGKVGLLKATCRPLTGLFKTDGTLAGFFGVEKVAFSSKNGFSTGEVVVGDALRRVDVLKCPLELLGYPDPTCPEYGFMVNRFGVEDRTGLAQTVFAMRGLPIKERSGFLYRMVMAPDIHLPPGFRMELSKGEGKGRPYYWNHTTLMSTQTTWTVPDGTRLWGDMQLEVQAYKKGVEVRFVFSCLSCHAMCVHHGPSWTEW